MKELHKAVLVGKSEICTGGVLNLSRQAFVHGFDEVVEEAYGMVDPEFVRSHLGSGDALFVEDLGQLGNTQEAVLSALITLVRDTRIEVFLVDGGQNTMEVDLSGVGLLDAFGQLDVILRAA